MNKRSRKIPVKLGFREEGVIRQAGWLHDHFVDYVIYGILASEWAMLTTSAENQG